MKSFLLKIWKALPNSEILRGSLVWLITQKFLVGVVGVVLNDVGQILLVKHTYREKYPWGLPSGWLKRGEQPMEALKREIKEETGYVAKKWISFGKYILDPNRGVADMHLFLASEAKKVAQPIIDVLEDQELIILNRDEIEKGLYVGEFKILTWTAVISLSLHNLDLISK
jgi:ADP-ribose pyrophosphatase YjhB (NUDIX family)